MFLRGSLIVSILLATVGVGAAQAPLSPLPPAPLPLPPNAAEPVLVQTPPPGPPPVLVPAPPTGTPVLVDPAPFGSQPPVMYVQEPPPPPSCVFWQPPGWFVALEASPTLPHIQPNHDSYRDGFDLRYTVAPRAELGYCFQHGGSLYLSYRNLTGTRTFDDPINGQIHTRLNANWLDLTYLSRPYNPCGGLALQWEAGVRSAYLFGGDNYNGDGWYERTSNTFGGAGPHAGLRLAWWFGQSGWSLFTRFDVAVLFGSTRLRDRGGYVDDFGNLVSWDDAHSSGRSVGDARFELGVGYVVPAQRWLRFDAGFQSEAFTWQSVTFSDSGPFLRCVLGF
jgi:hypothetical protein